MLSNEEIILNIRKAKEGDDKAKEVLFINNTPLIKSIIKRFCNKGVEYDDLYQIACMGLVKAINNFDEKFEVKFSTYSVPMIIGEIKRYMRDNGAIKVSRNLKILANKINRFINDYKTKNNDSPSVEFLSKQFDVTEEEVVMALDSSRMPLSIFDKFEDEDDSMELMERIPYVDEEETNLTKIHLSTIISGLSDREKKIVSMRFYNDKTQSEIADELGVSQVQVSRLENKIIEKIRLKY